MKHNKVAKIIRGRLLSLFITSVLCVGMAQADGYMNCWVEYTAASVNVFQQGFSEVGTIIFYWGYRSNDGIGEKGMFTNFDKSGFAFSYEPSTPTTMTVEHKYKDSKKSINMIDTWILRRMDELQSAGWGGVNFWKLKIVRHKMTSEKKEDKTYDNIVLSCDEFSGTPKKPTASEDDLTNEK